MAGQCVTHQDQHRVPDVLRNFLEVLRGETQSPEGQCGCLDRLGHTQGGLPRELFLLLANVTPPRAGFSKIP